MLKRCLLVAACVALLASPAAAQIPSHYQDLRDWSSKGLPLAAMWNTGKFELKWHAAQVIAGHRFLPTASLRLVSAVELEGGLDGDKLSEISGKLTASTWAALRDQRVPICLRTHNISNILAENPLYRFPNDLTYLPQSPVVWRLVNGALDQEQLNDCFGPVAAWADEGRKWAIAPEIRAYQQLLPAPSAVILLENNEGSYPENVNRWTRPVEPLTRDSLQYPLMQWKTDQELTAENLRMRDRVRQLRSADPQANPADFLPEYWTLRANQYNALFDAMEAGLSPGWRSDFRTSGYGAMKDSATAKPARAFDQFGYDPSLAYYDSGCQGVYVLQSKNWDFTSLEQTGFLNWIPSWEAARARNPKCHRELMLFVNNDATYKAAAAGIHDVMTPARWEGFAQWLLWSIHDPGVPVILRYWCDTSIGPTAKMFSTEDYAALDALGASAMKTATTETYVKPLIQSVNRATTNATLRDFWLQGSPVIVPGLGHPDEQKFKKQAPYFPQPGQPDNRWRVLECSINPPRDKWVVSGATPTKLKMWAVATRLNDSVLIYSWTPCKLSGKVNIAVPDFGTVTIDVPQPWSFWLVNKGSAPQRLNF